MNRGSFLIWVAVVILLVIAAFFYFPALRSKIPGLGTPSAPQTLVGEVEGLDLGNLDAEFENIDADLNQL